MRPRRAGYEKSRNGCSTCKTRKIKCDETRPFCRRCVESGWKCEGPTVHQLRFVHDQDTSRLNTPIPQPEVSLFIPRHSEDERRAFHYWTHCAAPFFAGTIDASFCLDTIPQLAQTYGFVWDAAVCISILLEHVPYESLTTTFDSACLSKVTNERHRQALRFYNKAIADVRRLAECQQVDDSLIALSYIMFASVEFQQRNVKTAHDLMKRCCAILKQNVMSVYGMPNSAVAKVIHEVVTPFVLRKAIVIATLGDSLPLQGLADGELGNTRLIAALGRFPAFKKAKAQFYTLIHDSYEVVRLADFGFNLKDDDPGKLIVMFQRQLLLDELTQWKASFTAMSSLISDAEIDWMASYLLLYWSVCYTSLAACVSLRQTVFDDHTDYFTDIIHHAIIILKNSALYEQIHTLSDEEPGVIPALYFCATKCRHPILRRQALHLIRHTPRGEDLWAFVAVDRVVARVISLEEAGHYSIPSESSSQPFHFPPEERRFAYISIVGRQGHGSKQRQALELSRFSFAADGSKILVTEHFWLEDEEDVWSNTQCQGPGVVARDREVYPGMQPCLTA